MISQLVYSHYYWKGFFDLFSGRWRTPQWSAFAHKAYMNGWFDAVEDRAIIRKADYQI
mgnify:CR=1 FL=1